MAAAGGRVADHRAGATRRAGRPAADIAVTGTIVKLASGSRTGVIRATDGSRVLFAAAVVLGEFETLAVGHCVSYDLDRAAAGTAARVLREPTFSSAPRRADAPPQLRYRGFAQAHSIRSYCFDCVATGSAVRRFIVTVDLLLLAKYHIGIQEAPVLCMRKLAADLEGSPHSQTHELDNDDLLAHASARDAQASRRKPRPPMAGRRGAPPPKPWRA